MEGEHTAFFVSSRVDGDSMDLPLPLLLSSHLSAQRFENALNFSLSRPSWNGTLRLVRQEAKQGYCQSKRWHIII